MAVLALYPFASNLHVAIAVEQNVLATSLSLELSEDQLVAEIENWLETLQINPSDLEFMVTSGELPPNYSSGLYVFAKGFIDANKANSSFQLYEIVRKSWKIPVYLVDPASRLECNPLALVTGSPELYRGCLCDSFIFKYLARQEEIKRGLTLNEGKFIVAYLDEEIQFGVIERGSFVDGGCSRDEGPFAWQQSGTLPFGGLLDLCLQMEKKAATLDRIHKNSGLKGYLECEKFGDFFTIRGGKKVEVVAALAHQIGKEIGAYASVLHGRVDSLIFFGELTKEPALMENLLSSVGFLGASSIYKGNQGIQALFNGAKRIRAGEPILELRNKGGCLDGVC